VSTDDEVTVTITADDSAAREALASAAEQARLWADTMATYYSLAARCLGERSASFDSRLDWCWRCDAKQAETDVGLCTPCHGDLRTP
jgi:hypothetical protein